jgi:cytochrome b6-f complex iron-sulfur subunit
MNRRLFCELAVGSVCGYAMAGCGLARPKEAKKRVGLVADLTQGPIELEFNDEIVFISPDSTQGVRQFQALVLTCTHKACTVEWHADKNKFICPCHKGEYDRSGKVLGGKPPFPLRRLKTAIEGEELYVLAD